MVNIMVHNFDWILRTESKPKMSNSGEMVPTTTGRIAY